MPEYGDGYRQLPHYLPISIFPIYLKAKYIRARFFNDSKTPLEIELNWRTKEDIDRISTIESDPSRFFFVHTDRSAVKVTVPKGTKSLYESHWLWSHLGGIEERP